MRENPLLGFSLFHQDSFDRDHEVGRNEPYNVVSGVRITPPKLKGGKGRPSIWKSPGFDFL
jgi:hypothetical protein